MNKLRTLCNNRMMAVALLALVPTSSACGQPALRSIRVGLGMTVAEMIAGSTYPLLSDRVFQNSSDTCSDPENSSNIWIINSEFNLAYVHNDKKLIIKNIGGQHFTSSIGSGVTCKIDSLSLILQDRPLTLEEAIKLSSSVGAWLVSSGYRDPSREERVKYQMIFQAPYILQFSPRSMGSNSNSRPDLVRAAFLDPEGSVERVVFDEKIDGCEEVSLIIVNGRRTFLNPKIKPEFVEPDINALIAERRYRVFLEIGYLGNAELGNACDEF